MPGLPALKANQQAMASLNLAVQMQEKSSPKNISHSPYSSRFSAAQQSNAASTRSVLTQNSWRTATGEDKKKMEIPVDFTSDVGRKKFGFSHEELDNAAAYYEGQFKISMRHGHGVMHNPETGAKYVGKFQADQFHGDGDQLWSDGSRYTGQWVRGQKHGVGTYVSADSLKYQGQWESSRRHGQGAQEYANGDQYKGWWFNGLCNGIGTYYFSDGSQYEGVWSNGRYDGVGTLYGSDGSRERQGYSAGLLMKREVLPGGSPPKRGARWNAIGGKVLFDQVRDEMHKPTMLAKPQVSKYLIRRETAGVDLSAPPLKPRTAPAAGSRGMGLLDSEVGSPPASAPGRLGGADRPVTARGPSEGAL